MANYEIYAYSAAGWLDDWASPLLDHLDHFAINLQTCPVAVSTSFAHLMTGRMPAASDAGIKPSGNRVLQGVCCTIRLQQCTLAVTLDWTLAEPLSHSKLLGARRDVQNIAKSTD